MNRSICVIALAAALSLPLAAHADPAFVIITDAQREIVFTNVRCTPSKGSEVSLMAYSSVVNGPPIFGCWTADTRTVFVLWQSPDGSTFLRSYPTSLVRAVGKYAQPPTSDWGL